MTDITLESLLEQIVEHETQIRLIKALINPLSDYELDAFDTVQARAKPIFAGFGKRVPRPLPGEQLNDYRRRLATNLKCHSTNWQDIKLSRVSDEELNQIEAQIYAEATLASMQGSILP
jgi:hypothetical protein